MKRFINTTLLLIITFLSFPSSSYSNLSSYTYVPMRRTIRYAEEFYALYRENMYRGTENLNANVHWVEWALKSPFAHPVKALAKIETPKQWKKYKILFHFQLYYLITEMYLRLGERYEKRNLLWFNSHFKKEIKDGFEISKIYYKRAGIYWAKVTKLSKILWAQRDLDLYAIDGEVDKWEDRVYRIIHNNIEVNYPKEIKKRLAEVDYKLKKLEKGEYKK